jgi:hypothetical protein
MKIKTASEVDKAIESAIDYFESVDLSDMTDDERRLHHSQQALARALLETHRHTSQRLDRIEDLLRKAIAAS